MIKRITKKNFYRPKNIVSKSGDISLRQFNLFISNFVDKYDWGNDKKHFYNYRLDRQITKELLNHSFTSIIKTKNSTFYKSANYKLTEKDISLHLHSKDKKSYIYYVNSQFSSSILICLDVDPLKTTTPADIALVKDFLLSIHPGAYFEPSTNGEGLHFYILLDLSVYDKIDSSLWNSNFNSYSQLLKQYINSNYNVNYDAIKSTYSSYSFSKEHNTYLLNTCGVLCKLPRPVLLSDYQRLYSIPFTEIDTINKNAHYLLGLMTDKNDSSTTYPSSSLPITTVLGSKPILNSKNQGFNTNSMEAEREYILKHIREYYKEHNELPTLEQSYQSYKNDTGYCKIGEGREERFAGIYQYCRKGFDSKKIVKKRPVGIYYKKDYVHDLKQLLTEEQLLQMQKDINSKFKGKITYEDVSIAAGFYFVSLTRLLEQKNWSGKEFTIPQNNMIKFFDSLNKKLETARTCTTTAKAKILKDILIKLDWLSCIDSNYIICKQSRRHILTAKFPRYSEFVEIVGADNIQKWIVFTELTNQKKTSA